jgi:hypothetical protein
MATVGKVDTSVIQLIWDVAMVWIWKIASRNLEAYRAEHAALTPDDT